MDEKDTLPEARGAAPLASGSEWTPWGDVHPALRAAEQGKLIEFVDRELRVGWPKAASLLEACFPSHGDVVLQLRSLRLHLRDALIPQLNDDGTVGTAEVGLIKQWQEELHQYRDLWVESFKSCHGKTCPRMESPETSAEDMAAWHAKEVGLAARAWGQVPTEPERYLEPYEQAARGAEHRASRGNGPRSEASEYDGDPGPGEPDPYETVPTW